GGRAPMLRYTVFRRSWLRRDLEGATGSSFLPPRKTNSRMLQISRGITPKGQLRALPAPSQLNCDTSYCQLLHTDRSARRLHPTLYRDRSSRYSLRPDQHSGRPANGGNG